MKRTMFLKAKNSFVGRTLRRLLGEEKGAIMMEYVVLGLLIAAVAVVAVGYFGTALSQMFGGLTSAMVADPNSARTTVAAAKTTAGTGATASQAHRTAIQTDSGSQDAVDTTSAAGW